MWLVFDRLWVRDALQEMQSAFSRNLRLLAELIEQCRERRILKTRGAASSQLRDRINEGFNAVKAQSDAVLFEFGPSRQRKLKIRDDFRRWQPTLGSLLQVQVTYTQDLIDRRLVTLPQPIAEAQLAFQKDMATVTRDLADEVARKPVRPAPDLQQAAARLRDAIEQHYGADLPPRPADIITLTQNLVAILAPLYLDIQSEFAILNK